MRAGQPGQSKGQPGHCPQLPRCIPGQLWAMPRLPFGLPRLPLPRCIPGQLWAMPRLPFGLPRLPCPQIDKTVVTPLIRMWNSLPSDIVNCNSLRNFKLKLKSFDFSRFNLCFSTVV